MGFWSHLTEALRSIPLAGRLVPGSKFAGNPTRTAPAGQGVDGKVSITEANALTLSAVWAAVRVISGGISILPLHVYNRGPGREKSDADPGLPGVMLATNPNPEMTDATFWETVVAHMLTSGNGYAEIERDNVGRPLALWPIPPNMIRPKRIDDALKYEATDPNGGPKVTIDAEDVFHVPGLGFDGLRGYSPVEMAKRSLGITATSEQAGETFFAEGMRPSGYLEFPGSLQDLQKLNLKETLKQEHGGARNFGKRLILYGGMKFNQAAISPDDAQFLETRQFQTVEIARWFNVPPHMLRDLSRATFSNIEHQGIDFITHTLLYWLKKICREYDRKVLGVDSGLMSEHVTEALMRGDTISRYTAYGMARQWGWMNVNEIRRAENRESVPGGDVYLQPVNMVEAGGEPQQPKPPVPPGDKGGMQREGASAKVDPITAAVRRNVSLEICELTANAADSKGFTDWIEAGYGSVRKVRILGDLNAAGVDFLAAHQFAAKWIASRKTDLNKLVDETTPKDLPLMAEQLGLKWSVGAAKLAEEARGLIA